MNNDALETFKALAIPHYTELKRVLDKQISEGSVNEFNEITVMHEEHWPHALKSIKEYNGYSIVWVSF